MQMQEIQKMWVRKKKERCGFDPQVGKGPLKEEMATHSSILAWEIPRTEEPRGLQSMGLQSWTGLSNWADNRNIQKAWCTLGDRNLWPHISSFLSSPGRDQYGRNSGFLSPNHPSAVEERRKKGLRLVWALTLLAFCFRAHGELCPYRMQ